MRKEIKFFLKYILLVFALGTAGQAQDSKAVTEIVGSTEKIITGSPFSAEVISENVQVLADGNKITRRMTTRMYRDSEGRFRRDEMPNPGGIWGSVIEFSPTLFIIDPVIGTKYYLNTISKTVRQQPLKANKDRRSEIEILKADETARKERQQVELKRQRVELEILKADEITRQKKFEEEKQRDQRETLKRDVIAKEQKRRDEIQAMKDEDIARQAGIITKESRKNVTQATNQPLADNPISPDNTKTESLGIKNIEGVQIEGTRTITTIPAGKIGNEKAIDIVYERWYSKDLQLIILSKLSDPRFGEQSYRLTNINRSEPNRSLFSIPVDYKIINQPKPKSPSKEKSINKLFDSPQMSKFWK